LLKIFKGFDPRLAAELKSQRRSIMKGLLCVGLGALLTAATIPLTERAIRAIGEASPASVDVRESRFGDEAIAEEFGISVARAREIIAEHPPEAIAALPSAEAVSQELGVPLDEARAKLESAAARVASSESTGEVRARQEEALRTLGMICLAVVGLFIVKYFFTRGQTYYLSRAATRLASELRMKLYAKLQKMPVTYFNERRTGSIQSILTNDVGVYQNAVNIIRDSIDGPFKAIAALVTIFIIQWQLAIVALLFIPVLAWFVQRNGRKMREAQAQVQENLAELTGVTQEALTGSRVVKAFAAENRMVQIYNNLVEKTFASQMKAVARFAKLRPMVELVGAISLATILYICGYMARAGTLQISEIVALTLALDIINQGARALSNVNNTYNTVQAAAARIYGQILDAPEEVVDDPGQRTLAEPVGRVSFENVSFTYPDGTVALKNVSFEIEPGTSLALVGPSGAGKSTIADLLLRFYDPTEGRILFDGVDIRELKGQWYRAQIGVVPQQTFLFAGTIAENLRLGDPTASHEQIVRSAAAAHADVFIEQTPEKYETVLGERGVRLSGGEGQRIAIARALVRNPKVLLLDEATSNLDAQSERVVTAALEEIMQTRTTLFIAHRLTTAARATRIVVLRRGEVLETGSHDELMEKGGAYAGMFKAFTSGVLSDDLG
jgi:subfamily B ATP-binding cassette protein MsbA